MTVCTECNGTGEYRGFNVVEPCKACNPMVDKNGDVMRYSSGQAIPRVGAVYPAANWQIATASPGFSDKRMDEMMPAELEGLKPGDTINVEIECENPTRIISVLNLSINRPLFGYPENSFFIRDIEVTEKRGYFKATLQFISKDRVPNVPCACDRCDDMTFTMMEDTRG